MNDQIKVQPSQSKFKFKFKEYGVTPNSEIISSRENTGVFDFFFSNPQVSVNLRNTPAFPSRIQGKSARRASPFCCADLRHSRLGGCSKLATTQRHASRRDSRTPPTMGSICPIHKLIEISPGNRFMLPRGASFIESHLLRD